MFVFGSCRRTKTLRSILHLYLSPASKEAGEITQLPRLRSYEITYEKTCGEEMCDVRLKSDLIRSSARGWSRESFVRCIDEILIRLRSVRGYPGVRSRYSL